MTTFGDRVFQSGGQPLGGDSLLGLMGDGKVIFVDATNGSDGNTGLKLSNPTATIGGAQTTAESNRGDVVLILPGNYSHTAALAITKDDVQYVAATSGGTKMHRTGVLVDANASFTTGPVVQITTANETAWYGIAFGSRSSAAGDKVVNSSAFAMGDLTTNTGQSNHLEGCYFPSHQNSDSLLYMASGSRSSIVDCTFGGLATNPEHGITLEGSIGASANIIIKNCIFKRLTSGIQLGDVANNGAAMQDHLFVGNYFVNVTTAFEMAGASTPSRCLIADNYFTEAPTNAAVCRNSSSGDGRTNAETDGWRFAGNHYKADVTS